MGGCATKPKVLKGDEGEVPVPPPEPTKEPVPMVPEAKEAANIAAEGQDKVEADVFKAKDVDEAKEVGNDDKVDDQTNKRQSLSNLFKENENKGSTENDNASSQPMKIESQELVKQESLETGKQESPVPVKQESAEPVQIKSVQPVKQESAGPVKIESLEPVQMKSVEPVKQESAEPIKTESLEPVQIKAVEPVKQELQQPEKQATSDTEKLKEAYVTMTPETEAPAKPIEQTYKPEPVVVAPGKIETEQSIESKAAPDAAATTVNVPEMQNKKKSAPGKIETE
ncbi:hypothetical protein DITRI_Ditri18aG0047100 [Diplodiscus trichospermus]